MKKITTTVFLFCFAIVFAFSQHGTPRAYMGVHSNSVSKKKARKLNFDEPNGAYITNVINNTAAEKSGLQPFDYIYQIGEYQFNGHQSLSSVMRNFQPEDEAKVYFIRNGKKMSKQMTFGKKSDSKSQHRSDEEDPFLGVEQNHSDVPKKTTGVAVSIVKNSTAEKMGLEDDDIIMEINDFPMYDWHDLRTAIDMMEVGDEMKLKYLRGNKMTVAYSPIQSLAATKKGYSHGSYNYSYSYGTSKNHHQKNNEEKTEPQDALTQAIIANDTNDMNPMPDMDISINDMPKEDAEEMKNNLGIDMPVVQNLSIEQLKIFPNPSQGIFNLKFNLLNNAPTAIRIFDQNGKMIYSNDLGNFTGDFNEQLDLSSNPAGTYYLMVQQGKLSISKKVIIVRA